MILIFMKITIILMWVGGGGEDSMVNDLVQLPNNTKIRYFLVREQYLSQVR